jgi:hypothetical protein
VRTREGVGARDTNLKNSIGVIAKNLVNLMHAQELLNGLNTPQIKTFKTHSIIKRA